jgi:uncharacterized protein
LLLRLDLGSLPDGPSHVELSADASEIGAVLDCGRLESPVRLVLDVDRKGSDIFLRGKASVTAVLECARCLEEYSCLLESPIELWVSVGGVKHERDAEDRDSVIEVQQGAKYVDLTDPVRSELLVLLPLKQLCRPDCKGLCQRCGTNLNASTCGCHLETQDSRWEALKKLKQNP